MNRFSLRAPLRASALAALAFVATIAPAPARGGMPLVLDLSGFCPGDGSEVTNLLTNLVTANAASVPAEIILAPKCVYSFTASDNGVFGPNALPAIVNDVTIVGQGARLVRASTATAPFRFFFVAGATAKSAGLTKSTGSLTLRDLSLESGLAQGGGGGNGVSGGGGGAGLGGAIYAQGDLTLSGLVFIGNGARGGNGGNVDGSLAGGASGGGGGLGGGGGSAVATSGGVSGGNPGSEAGGGGGARGDGATAGGANGGGGGMDGNGSGSFPLIGKYTMQGSDGGGPNGGAGGQSNGSGGGIGGGGGGGGTDLFGADGAVSGGAGGAMGGGGGGTTGGTGGIGGGGGGGGAAQNAPASFTLGPGGAGGFGGGGGGGAAAVALGGYGGGDGGGQRYASTPMRAGRAGVGANGGPGGGGSGLGGAIFVEAGSASVTNCSFSGNHASGGAAGTGGSTTTAPTPGLGQGGAIFGRGGTIAIDSSTFVANGGSGYTSKGVASNAVAIAVDGALATISNTIVYDVASAGSATCAAASGSISSKGHNLVAPPCTTPAATDAVAATNPVGALHDNGGPTQTFAIDASSAAYGHGLCTVTLDQRGLVRPVPSGCDIGAFELASTVSVTLAGSGTGSVSSTPSRLDCPGTCSARFKPTESLTLTATPSASASFAGFGGDVSSTSNTVAVPLLHDATITATFDALATADAGTDATSTDAASADAGSDGASAEASATTPTEAGPAPTHAVGAFVGCKQASDCATGVCVEGVCCDRACDGVCESCALPESPGVCSPVLYGRDPKSACGAAGTCLHTCDGHGACTSSFAGAQCAPSSCTDESHGRGEATCTASGGVCDTSSSLTFDCGNYQCDPAIGACKSVCVSSADCATGRVCDTASRTCVPATSSGGGCTFDRRGAETGGALVAVLAALSLVGRRRRR